jgi:hypothetical protein
MTDFVLEDRTVPTDFTNPAAISIPADQSSGIGQASPYPSTISVTGLTGQQITNLTVTFHGLSHTSPDNIDAMLIAPNGTHIYLMSDCGGGADQPISNLEVTFDDAAANSLTTGPITSGTYKPTNIDQGDPDTIPGAPSGAAVTTLSAFKGIDPDGTWELRINDDTAFDTGAMATGWTLHITSRSNSAPVANNDSYTFNEDTTLTTTANAAPFGVLHNDTDADNDPLTAKLLSNPAHGVLTFNLNDGSFTYAPFANFNGTDTFTYQAYDGIATSNTATVTLNVTAVNDVPIANDDNLTIQNGGPVTIQKAVILNNDIDPDLTYRTTIFGNNFEGLATQPYLGSYGGTGADGTDWGEIPAGWTRDNTTTPAPASPTTPGTEFFGWHAADIDSWISEQGDQARSSFTRGGAGSHGTVLIADGDTYADFVPIDPNLMTTYLYTPQISLAGINQDSLQLEFDSSFRPEDAGTQFARVYVSVDGAPWTMLSDFDTSNTPGGVGSTYHINDHLTYNVGSSPALTNALNAKSVQFRWGYEQAGNDWWWAIDNVQVTGAKTDPAQETIQIQSQPSQGSVAVDANGAVVYTPPSPTFTGTTSFTYQDFDGVANSNTATVTLTVNGNTVAPVANNDSYNTVQATPLTVHYDQSVLANDTDADLGGGNVGLTAALVSGPTAAQGTVSFHADGTFTFNPNPAFFGTATFTYKDSDGTNTSNTATVSIVISQNNFSAPVANNDNYSVNNNGTLTVPAATGVLANDTDADNNPLTAQATKGPNGLLIGPNHGTLTFNADGSFTYVPRPFFNGTDSFTYQAFDGAFLSNVATVTITVNAVNVAPQANPDVYFTPANTQLTVNAPGVLANDRDDGANVQLYLETFDELTLQPFNSGVPGGDGTDYTDALPTGYVRDNTNTPAPATPTTAGDEFFGWHAMDANSWIAEQGNQARGDFTRGGAGMHGTVLVADGDAYDDFVDIHTGTNRMNTLLVTPSIPLGSIIPNSLELEFDSSFRPESPPPGHQHGRVEVSYDGGTTWIDLLDLTTATSGGVGSRSRTNEHDTLDAMNPAGATSAMFRFSYLEATNDWWWAIDNIKAVGSNANAGAHMTAQIVNAPPTSQGTVSLNTDGSFTFNPASGFIGMSTFTYRANDGVNNSAPTTVQVLVGAQAGVTIDDGLAQRSMVRSVTVTFAGAATFAGAPSAAFTLTDGTGANVPFNVALSTVAGDTVATLTFTGSSIIGGSLADGRYTLTVLSNQVTLGGQPLDGDGDGVPGGNLVAQFFRFYGDVNGDGTVNGLDYAAFRASFGSTTGGPSYVDFLDYNADGTINGLDFAQFRARFGTTLP